MTIINESLLSPAMQFTVPPGARPDEWVRMTVADYPDLPWMMAGNLNGAKTSNAVVGYSAPDGSGAILTSFFDHFYNRIHVTPATIDLGNVTANSSVTVELWNSYLSDKDVVSTNFSNDSGVEVTGAAAPYTLPPLGFQNYDVTVLQDGPANVRLSLGWVVGVEPVGFTVSAVRIVPFFYPPNWGQGIDETLEWRTIIAAARNGDEQRQQIRGKPRREWNYSVLLSGDDARMAYFDILGFQNKTFGLPIWTGKTKLTSQASSAATVLNAVTANRGFATDGVLFIEYGGLVETHEIESFTGSTISLKKPLTSSFPVGSVVYPGTVVRLAQNFQARRPTDQSIESNLTFTGLVNVTDPDLPTVAAPVTLDGFEVITRKPNWASGMDVLFDYPVDELDFLSGQVQRFESRDYPATGFRLRYLIEGRSDMATFRAMLARLKGRSTPVFVSLFTDDFKLSGSVPSSATGFQVYDNHSDLGIFPERHPLAVLFETRDAGNIARRASSTVLNLSGLIDVQITQGPGVTITQSTLKRLSLCPLVRLASDQVTIKWVTDTVAECELTFVMVSR